VVDAGPFPVYTTVQVASTWATLVSLKTELIGLVVYKVRPGNVAFTMHPGTPPEPWINVAPSRVKTVSPHTVVAEA